VIVPPLGTRLAGVDDAALEPVVPPLVPVVEPELAPPPPLLPQAAAMSALLASSAATVAPLGVILT